MGDDDAVRRWTVCGRCHAVRGGPTGTVDGVTIWQLCDCAGKVERAAKPKTGDFNIAFELCRACGLELLRSGSKWSAWFCNPCAQRARVLNDQCGRCVFPVGRHSLMNGVVTRSTSEEDLDAFAGELWTIFGAMDWLQCWARTVVAKNLVSAGMPPDLDVDVATSLAAVRAVVRSEERFTEMVASRLATT